MDLRQMCPLSKIPTIRYPSTTVPNRRHLRKVKPVKICRKNYPSGFHQYSGRTRILQPARTVALGDLRRTVSSTISDPNFVVIGCPTRRGKNATSATRSSARFVDVTTVVCVDKFFVDVAQIDRLTAQNWVLIFRINFIF